MAEDANTLPPKLDLRSSGTALEPLRPYSGSLASYSTAEPDVSWGYPADSLVSFECFLDGLPTACSRSYYRPCCPTLVPKRLACPRRENSWSMRARRNCPPRPIREPYVPPGKTIGYGPFIGWVPIPADIAEGTHSVMVIATDEDGTDPDPPTVEVVVDHTPPSVPRILAAPVKVSHDRTPRFRFTATDDRRLRDKPNDPLLAQLKRIDPSGGAVMFNGSPLSDYLEWRGPFCPTLRRCTETVWPASLVDGKNGTLYRVRKHLTPGLYEFSVRARDLVGNLSRAARYRFRVLGKN